MRVISAALILSAFGQDAFTEGLKQFHRGDYQAAEKTFATVTNDARAKVFLALTRATTSRCAQAIPDLTDGFERSSDPDIRKLAGLALVQCHVSAERFDDAYSAASRLKAVYPDDADVLYQTARFHMRAWNDAIYQMFQKTPASFRVNQLSAEIFEIQANYPAAIAEYRKAIEKNERALNLHFRLGRALLLNSHAPETLNEAIQEFEAELKLNPYDAAAEYQIGQILATQQRTDEAATRFERALEINADFPEAIIALGRIRLAAKRTDEAIRLLERAVRILPRSEAARYSLMIAYRNAGRSEDALREKTELEKLQKPPEGEFTEFLKKLGEKKPE